MSRTYPHLRLTRWPFPIVPDEDFCTFLAARKELRKDVHEIVDALARRDTSSIQLFWAWFGAGKTHTVKYLRHHAMKVGAEKANNRLITVYTEFPKESKSFLDLYRSLLGSIDSDALTEAYLEVFTSKQSGHTELQRKLLQAAPDLFTALHVHVTGSALPSAMAFRWLRGDPVPMAELKKIGIVQRLTTSEEATRAVAAIVSLLNAGAQANGRPAARLIWIIDEFQRIRKAGRRGIDDINSGMHSAFNSCPNSLTFVLSFSGRPQQKLPDFFSRELRDRIGRTKVMLLPPMNASDATRLVSEVLAQFRSTDSSSAPFFPFSEESCKAIIADIEAKGELKPRAIMHAFNAVLQEAEQLIENGKMGAISADFVTKTLAEYAVADATEEEEDEDEE